MNKQLVFLSMLALLSACSAVQRKHKADLVRVRPVEVPARSAPQSNYDSARNAEVIKQYYAGDYIDPNNPNVKHVAHNVQRVEQSASWNLRPSEPVVAGGPTYVAATAAAQTNALSAQLSGALDRQKGYSDALTQQNEKLQEIIEQLRAAKEQEAQARAAGEAELKLTVETLKSVREAIQKQPAISPARPFPVFAPQPPSLFDRLNGSEESPPSNSMFSPKMKDLLDLVDEHAAALEGKPSSKPFEDTIELDDIYAPLATVAESKK